MNIKTSIYDFFGYTVPGGLLLLLVLHGLKTFAVVDYFSGLGSAGFTAILIFTLAAYLIGFVFDPVNRYVTNLYKSKDEPKVKALEIIRQRIPELDISDIHPGHWAIWFASIRQENLEIAFEIDRYLAYSKMMRGVCLAALLAFFMLIFYLMFGKVSIQYLLLVPVIVLIGTLSLLQAYKFRLGFYILIYEAVVARKPPFSMK